MRALLVTLVVTAIAALAGVGSATAAPPNFNAAASLCAAQGGEFVASPPFEYDCIKFGDFSAMQFRTAQVLCEQVYGGLFLPDNGMGFTFLVCFFDV
jgi:hypothetical protein